jgi:hypothetical protein
MSARLTLVLVAGVAAAALAASQMPRLDVQTANVADPATPPAQQPAAEQQPAEATESQVQEVDQRGGAQATADLERLLGTDLALPPPPEEYPARAQRDPNLVGRLDPAAHGFGPDPWRAASGPFLSTLLRRMDTPLASRWAHIALRNLLLSRIPAPRSVNGADWAAERAWLLLRMGEADAARMLVSGVNVDQFTPKMFQVAVQSALANSDPAALCPLQGGIAEVEPQVVQLVDAMCAALAGEPEVATAQIDSARRRGRVSAIDITLAQKVVGAAAETGRAVTVEWEPVERLNAWRYGLATATGLLPPNRLLADAPLQLRAWQAQAPMLTPASRWDAAQIAAGLGVLSSQSLVDLQSLIYDSMGPDDLPESDAWQLRLAFVGRTEAVRLEAMRRLWTKGDTPLEREAMRAMLARAAARVEPKPELQADAVNIIASMLAAWLDQDAARWAEAVSQMDEQFADPAWAMLALAAPATAAMDRSVSRIGSFVGRDNSPDRQRSALLVAGLAGLGYIDDQTATRLNSRYGLRLSRRSHWTRLIDMAAQYGQSGTSLVLAGTGLQAASWSAIPPSHHYHSIAALKRTGLEFTARMIAAEALART